MSISIIDIFLLGAFFLYLSIGAFLTLKSKYKPVNILLASISFSSAFWTLGIALFRIVPPDFEMLYFLNKEFIFAAGIIASSFLHFSLLFSKKSKDLSIFHAILLHSPNLFVFIFVNVPNVLIQDIIVRPWGRESILGWGYIYYGFYIMLYFLSGLYFLINSYFKATGNYKSQLLYIILATMITGSIDIYFNLILILMGNYQLIWVGPYSSFVWVLVLSYAITKTSLMDIRVVIGKSLAHTLTIMLLGGGYVAMALAYINFSPRIDPGFMLFTIIYGILVGEFFQRIRQHFQTPVDKFFVKAWYDFSEVAEKIISRFRQINTQAGMVELISPILEEDLDIQDSAFFFFDRERNAFLRCDRKSLEPDPNSIIALDNPLIQKIKESGQIVRLDKGPYFGGASIVIPAVVDEKIAALVVLGKKRSEDDYTDQDMRLFRALAGSIATALEFVIKPYEEVTKKFEANQKKLYDTERLLARSEKIASMASLIQEYNHQIKTPLGIIRSRMEMLFNKKEDIENLKKIKTNILKQIDRADYIVESTLRLGRPRERREVKLDLNKVIKTAAGLLLADAAGVHLIMQLNPIPLIMGDEEDLETVFINLIKNALEAMPDGGELRITTYSGVEDDEPVVYAEISDRGVGIPEENMEKIYEPFFSTDVTRGKGLGLSIVFRIIREHLGKIEVKSKVGVGTTFKIQLRALKE